MRVIKSIGISAVIALAFAAVASGASASGVFFADSYPVTVHGSGQFSLQIGSHVSQCETWSSDKTIEGPAGTLSTGPVETSSCSHKFNGCGFEFKPGSKTVDISPSGCGPITEKLGQCVYSISPVTGLPATYVNVDKGKNSEVLITLKEISLEYNSPCGGSTAKLSGTWKLTGSSAAKSAVGMHVAVAAGQQVGAFVSGGGIPGKLNAQLFPVDFSGVQALVGQSSADKEFYLLRASGAAVKCSTAYFGFGGTSAAALAEPRLSPVFEKCSYGALPVTVKTNFCGYTVTSISGWPNVFLASMALECPVGKNMEITIKDMDGAGKDCLLKLPSQALAGTQELENRGEGINATVALRVDAGNVQYEASGSGIKCNTAMKAASGLSGTRIMGGVAISGAYAG